MSILRKTLLAVTLVVASWIVGTVSDPPFTLSLFDRLPAHVRTAVEGAATWAAWAVGHPVVTGVVLAVVVLPQLVAFLASKIPRRVTTDPQRLYTAEERRIGSDLAGGRCEGEIIPFVRCRRPAAQGDHWYPHSLGGATSMENLVSLCAACTRAKSNKVPSIWQTMRLERRRRKYFPANRIHVRPGDKYGVR